MTVTQIAQALATKKLGQFYTIKMRRDAKTFKGTQDKVEKESVMQGILCDYSNRTPVKQGVEDGLREAPELPSHILRSYNEGPAKFWEGKTGKHYLALCSTGNAPKVQWYLNGVPCNKCDVDALLLASEKEKPRTKEEVEEKSQVMFFGIQVENILEVR